MQPIPYHPVHLSHGMGDLYAVPYAGPGAQQPPSDLISHHLAPSYYAGGPMRPQRHAGVRSEYSSSEISCTSSSIRNVKATSMGYYSEEIQVVIRLAQAIYISKIFGVLKSPFPSRSTDHAQESIAQANNLNIEQKSNFTEHF